MRFLSERRKNTESIDARCGDDETSEQQDAGHRCIGKGEVECSNHSSGTSHLAENDEDAKSALCADDGLGFFRGLGFAIPASVALWLIIVIVGLFLAGCTSTGSAGTSSFYGTIPPESYRGSGLYVVRTLDTREQVRDMCADVLGYRGDFMGCAVTRDGVCYIYAPNPNVVSVNFEPLFIHEAGHCNGWGGNHPWS